MKPLNRITADVGPPYPERVLQFGGGNFLRAFVDWMIDELNDKADFAGSIIVAKASSRKSSSNVYETLDQQDGLYHVVLTSSEKGQPLSKSKLICSVSRTVNPFVDHGVLKLIARQPEIRFVVSNTTESGIYFDQSDQINEMATSSFPAKLTVFLYERFLHFGGATEQGCIVIPCELIENNGDVLKQCVLNYATLWNLPENFIQWVDGSNYFCNTLVDRIVPGYPHERAAELQAEIGFVDPLLVEGESYHRWIIEGPEFIRDEFPADRIGLNVKFVTDATPYRELKVRILNGAHTSMVMVGYLYGQRSVRESIENETVGRFINDLVYEEILPTLDFSQSEKELMAQDVLQRFRNPFLHHQLMTISLNSTSKFRVRLLPTLLNYVDRFDELPKHVCLVFASLIQFYQGEWQGELIELKDETVVLEWWKSVWEADLTDSGRVAQVLRNRTIWGQDLNNIPGLHAQVSTYLTLLNTDGFDAIFQEIES